ncbi:MAG: AmmeMemoRadiSam system radical SAM enzyme [Caldilineaceae bacterium]|nr:AmmeMemoRadiSam system radical SAM enzyme [Caldilineaceae bacterium]
MLKAAELSRSLAKDHVQCTACEHWCAIAPGHAGKCGVRHNIGGTLHLLVYGRAAAVHVDPIEKKPLFHFLPGTPIFSVGTVGCNLSCAWCQNWEISQHKVLDPTKDAPGQEWLPEQIVAYCLQRKIPSVAFTYNEPAVFFEYAYDTAKLAHAAGLRTVFVSSGFETLRALETIAPYLDAVNVDLKAFREETYRTYCGARLEPVKRNIRHLVQELGIWTEVTTLVIPQLNDSDEELRETAEFLAGVSVDLPWHVSAFHPDYHMQDRPHTPAATLRRARDLGKAAGLRYVYTGNIWGDRTLTGAEDTACARCGTPLLRRSGYSVQQLWTQPGHCPGCGEQIAGRWGHIMEHEKPLVM